MAKTRKDIQDKIASNRAMVTSDRSSRGAPVSQGILSRLTQGVKFMISGVTPDAWFGPDQPLEPVAQEVQGRQYDYPVASNINYVPAASEKPINFAQLRALADSYDLMRLAIETRKDQLCRLHWRIKPKDKKDKGQDENVKLLTDFFMSPDKVNDWDTWLRALIEDVLVIDAPCLYPRFTADKKLYSVELMDGATIKILINDDGRPPLPPSPAYQQILHGVPAVDYSRDELIYIPRNVRTNKLYGYSVVEQVITTVNIALRRQSFQLEYYTSGSVPDALAAVPETWNPDQIKAFQDYWDALNSGNLAERRKLKFIPGGVSYTATKDSPLKDDYDEWLAKIISYAFSISPQALTKQMNRASAQQSQESSEEEGLAPYMKWIATLINRIIVKYFGLIDVEFAWEEQIEQDALKQAQINDIYVRNGTLSVDEVRGDLGRDPIGMKNAVYGTMGVQFVDDLLNPPEEPEMTPEQIAAQKKDPLLLEDKSGNKNENKKPDENQNAEKIEKAKKKSVLKPIDRDRVKVQRGIIKLRNYMRKFLKKQGKKIAAQLSQALGKADSDEIKRLLDQIDLEGWAVIVGDVEEILASMGKDGAKMAWIQLGGIPDDESIVSTADETTVEYAKRRAAELVGMRYNKDGDLVENPSAKWTITDTTRESLNGLVTQAVEEGWSNDRLASEIEDNYAFSSSRADTIARTEIKRADTQGSLEAYKASGVVEGKQSLLSFDYDDDDVCADNADDGVIPLEDLFTSGDDGPPYHPNCRCTVVPATIIEPVDTTDTGQEIDQG